MNETALLLTMIFCHIADDYYLQGKLANFKQRDWWTVNAPHKRYRRDYIMALSMHSMSWSFAVLFPGLLRTGFEPPAAYLLIFAANAVIHGVTDHFKANLRKINLVQDQLVHLVQIAVTFLIIK